MFHSIMLVFIYSAPCYPGLEALKLFFIDCFISGNLTPRHKEVFLRNPLFVGMRLPEVKEITPLEKKFPRISNFSLAFLKVSELCF